MRIVKGSAARSATARSAPTTRREARWLIIVATIPAGLLGLLLQDWLRKLFASPEYASIFLALNGLLLFGAERCGGARPRRRMTTTRGSRGVGWWQTFTVGAAQAIALIPGFSARARRWAAACSWLSHRDAARFAFLLATPIILAAAVLKLPQLAGPRGTACAARRWSAPLCSD